MKRLIYLILLLANAGLVRGQDYRFSFPSPEIRVDTIKPLSAYRLSIIKPLNVTGSLSVKGTRLPSMFMFECVDSINNHRFAVTKNGYLISGTHHNPTTNVDGLVMMGRGNTLFGADAMAIGKQVVNEADTTMALGYYYTVPENKHNMTIIGYGGNRIEMAADSGRFVGNWKLGGGGTGGIATESDPTVPNHVKSITAAKLTNWDTTYKLTQYDPTPYMGWGSVGAAFGQRYGSFVVNQMSDFTIAYTDFNYLLAGPEVRIYLYGYSSGTRTVTITPAAQYMKVQGGLTSFTLPSGSVRVITVHKDAWFVYLGISEEYK